VGASGQVNINGQIFGNGQVFGSSFSLVVGYLFQLNTPLLAAGCASATLIMFFSFPGVSNYMILKTPNHHQ